MHCNSAVDRRHLQLHLQPLREEIEIMQQLPKTRSATPNKTNTRCSIKNVFPSFSIIPTLHINNTLHNIRRSSSDFTIMKGLGLLGQCNVPELSGIVDFEWFQKRSQYFHYQRKPTRDHLFWYFFLPTSVNKRQKRK